MSETPSRQLKVSQAHRRANARYQARHGLRSRGIMMCEATWARFDAWCAQFASRDAAIVAALDRVETCDLDHIKKDSSSVEECR